MRILILDDQPGLAETYALSLRASGYPAIGFNHPADVLATIRELDVLVTDYHMPEMNGLELARRAYAQGWRGSLLIMSGHVASISEAIEHPLLHLILNKPFSIQELVKAMPDTTRPENPHV